MEWTDRRLDDLAKRVDDGFQEVKGDIKALDTTIDTKFDALDTKFDAKFDALDTKFDTKFGVLDTKIDTKFGVLDAKFDAKFGVLDAKVDTKFGVLDAKIDRLQILMLRYAGGIVVGIVLLAFRGEVIGLLGG